MTHDSPLRSEFGRALSGRLALLTGVVFLAGCATGAGEFGRTAGPNYVVYPTPPDTPRVQFLTTFSSTEDVSGGRGPSLLESLAGSDPEAPVRMVKPYGLGFRDGRFHICDVSLKAVWVVDARDRRFEIFQPLGEGALRLPTNCFTDPADGSLYIADVDRKQVVVFDSTLAYRGAFGEQEGARPTDVFVDEEHIWVADPAGERAVRVYDKTDFRYLRSFPEPGAEAPAKLFFPTHLWVQGDEVYVTDFGDFMVKVYSRAGEFLRTVGGYGRAIGQFVRPKGLAVDRDGILYVVDAGFQNVQMFNDEGTLLMYFGGAYGGPGGMWLPAKVTLAYSGLELFEPYVRPGYRLKYLILVSNQFGPDLINVYGFIEPAEVDGDEAP